MSVLLDDEFYNKIEKHFNNDTNRIYDFVAKGDCYINTDIRNVVVGSSIIDCKWKQVVNNVIYFFMDNKALVVTEKEVVAIICIVLMDSGELILGLEKETNTYINIEESPTYSWDEYFFNIAKQTARNSKCFSRKIGAVLVKDNSVIGTGYNGAPRGTPTCDNRWGKDPSLFSFLLVPNTDTNGICPRKLIRAKSGEHLDICPASHAEVSAITNAARMGITTKDASLYLTCEIPCCKCLPVIINAGISEIVVVGLSYYDKLSEYLLSTSKLKVRKYAFVK